MDNTHTLRHAWRALRKNWGLSLVSLITLAAGIGGLTALFVFINAVLFRPMPYGRADQIVALGAERAGEFSGFSSLSLSEIEALKTATRSFQLFGVFREVPGVLSGKGDAVQVKATAIDESMLALLAVRPVVGRTFTRDEIRTGAPIVLIGEAIRRQRWATAGEAIGATIKLDGVLRVVVGVMPEGFRFYQRSDVWVPLQMRPDTSLRVDRSFSMLGRLRPTATIQMARREVDLVSRRSSAGGESERSRRTLVVRDGMVDRGTRVWAPLAGLLFGAGVLVLILACSNVASLSLSRSVARRGEMAVRAALGATRSRLVLLCLAESGLLVIIATVLGAAFAVLTVKLLLGYLPLGNMPSWMRFEFDGRVLGVAAFLCLIVVSAIGITPAVEATRLDLATTLRRDADQAATRRGERRRGRIVTVCEIAVALTLCVAATSIARTYGAMVKQDRGYDPSSVIAASVYLRGSKYTDPSARRLYFVTLGRRVEQLTPGHVAISGGYAGLRAGAVNDLNPDTTQARIHDESVYLPTDVSIPIITGPNERPMVTVISDNYFRTLGLRLLEGREFGDADGQSLEASVIVSSRLAELLWPGESALGQRLRIGKTGAWHHVAGVASDRKDPRLGPRGLTFTALPVIYLSARQAEITFPTLFVRGTAHEAVAGALSNAIRQTDPDQPWKIQTLEEVVSAEAQAVAAIAALLAVFSFAGLVLALLGVVGTMSHLVHRRTRELAVRLAMGADKTDLLRMIMTEGAKLTVTGLTLGGFLLWLASHAAVGVVHGMASADPLTIALTIVTFGMASLAASYVPGRFVSSLDAARILREQ